MGSSAGELYKPLQIESPQAAVTIFSLAMNEIQPWALEFCEAAHISSDIVNVHQSLAGLAYICSMVAGSKSGRSTVLERCDRCVVDSL